MPPRKLRRSRRRQPLSPPASSDHPPPPSDEHHHHHHHHHGDEEAAQQQTTADEDLSEIPDLRKLFQCPICLGIMKKTRTMGDCLHRFCKECIDKSFRLSNNECPACRTHCASRRSLRTDANFDRIISTVFPDIDAYEEQVLVLDEEEKARNREIQESIAWVCRRQSEGTFRRSGKQGEDTESIGLDENEESPAVRRRRRRLSGSSQSALERDLFVIDTAAGGGGGRDVVREKDDGFEEEREKLGALAINDGVGGTGDLVAWGKGGTRSRMRHGKASSSSGDMRVRRMPMLVDHLSQLDEKDDEFDVNLLLLPLEQGHGPCLDRPHLLCRPTLSVGHVCRYIAFQVGIQEEEVEVLVSKPQCGMLEGPQVVGTQETVGRLYNSYATDHGDLLLTYRIKMQARSFAFATNQMSYGQS